MKSLINKISSVIILLVFFLIGFHITSAVGIWNPAPGAPSASNNTDLPIEKTYSSQIKLGSLYLTGLNSANMPLTTGLTITNGNMSVGPVITVTKKLDIKGGLRMSEGASDGKVIVSDTFGNGSWGTMPERIVSPPSGAVVAFNLPPNSCPTGWSPANGTNGTPDLRNRNIIGAGTGLGLSARTIGAIGGEEIHVLTESEFNHTHNVPDDSRDDDDGSDDKDASKGDTASNINLNFPTDYSFNVLDPYHVLSFCIKN